MPYYLDPVNKVLIDSVHILDNSRLVRLSKGEYDLALQVKISGFAKVKEWLSNLESLQAQYNFFERGVF